MTKNLGAPNWVRSYSFCHFLEVASLVFLDIAQDYSLGQYLTSSRAETSKKKKKICAPNWDRNDLFYSNVVDRPLKLACLPTVHINSFQNVSGISVIALLNWRL